MFESGRGGSRGSAAISREKTAEIRQWAKEHGLQVSERGRISAAVVEQYEAAH
ncbi:histone-like nucleoid-structuring protein Lsr2 [Nonomuraea dietziae]|uniref:Lsr2 family DNA-binding protein n=1 Tax=Nonomuraea dietziae TaxID=65515 RepID=UPI0036075FF0